MQPKKQRVKTGAMGLRVPEGMALQNKFLKTDLRDCQIRMTLSRNLLLQQSIWKSN